MISRFRRFQLSVVALATYWGFLFVSTHVPLKSMSTVGEWDKALHFGAYGGLAFLLACARGLKGPLTWRTHLILWACVGAYGIVDEC